MKKLFLVLATACLSLAAVNVVAATEFHFQKELAKVGEQIKDTVLCGDSLIFVATPEEGYKVEKWEGLSGGNTSSINATKDTLIVRDIHAHEEDIQVYFELKNYLLHIDVQCINGEVSALTHSNFTITVSGKHSIECKKHDEINRAFYASVGHDNFGDEDFFYKDTLTIRTGNSDEGDCYEFLYWVDDSNPADKDTIRTLSFNLNMPAANKHYIAVYQKKVVKVQAEIVPGADGNRHGVIKANVYRKPDEK